MSDKALEVQHDEIREAISIFGEQLKSTRESMAYAAPEMHDGWWQRISQDATDLVERVIELTTCARCRVCGCTDEYGCDEGCEWVEEDLCSSCIPSPGGQNANL